jgi:hypothetical protein
MTMNAAGDPVLTFDGDVYEVLPASAPQAGDAS